MKRVPLVLRLAVGDIAHARASLIAVGHVNGLPPSGAERSIDLALGGALSRRSAAGLLDGHFGAAQFIPAVKTPLAADAVLVLALGEAGRLDRARLPELGSAIVDALETIGAGDVATVIHGAGGMGVSATEATRHLLSGLYAAIDRLSAGTDVRTITLVEFDDARLPELRRAVEATPVPERLSVYVDPEPLRLPAASGAERTAQAAVPPHLRLGITRPGNRLKVTVISENAYDVAAHSDYPLDAAVQIQDAVEREIVRGTSARARERAMRAIGERLYREFLGWVEFDLAGSIRASRKTCVVLRLDEATADLPWELLTFARRFLCHGTALARQREITGGSGRPAAYVPAHERLRALVVGDPLGDLPGARQEAAEVAAVLRAAGAEVREHVGALGRDEFAEQIEDSDPDVLHYAGHARFDSLSQASGGLMLSDGVVTANDLMALRRLPRVVFANACNSGQSGSLIDQRIADGSAATHDFAGGLLQGGARSFVGSQWPVDDHAALTFARAFHAELASAREPATNVGDAIRAARQAVITAHGRGQSAWAGYVHYGRPWELVL